MISRNVQMIIYGGESMVRKLAEDVGWLASEHKSFPDRFALQRANISFLEIVKFELRVS
jgi:hypothetical protein